MTTQQRWADPLDAAAAREPFKLGTSFNGIPVEAPNSEYLKGYLHGMIALGVGTGYMKMPALDMLMEVTCKCGKRHHFATFDDIPAESVTCECGRPVIQYTEAIP
jgi:hypothetical protein